MTIREVSGVSIVVVATIFLVGCTTPSREVRGTERLDTLLRVQPIQLQTEDDMEDLLGDNLHVAELLHELARTEAIHHYAVTVMSQSNAIANPDYIENLKHFDFAEYRERQEKLRQNVEKRIRDLRALMAPCACGKCIPSMYKYVPDEIRDNPLKSKRTPNNLLQATS